MQPIIISISAKSSQTPAEICAFFLDTKRWSEFKGSAFLPGIRAASFENQTPGLVGSRIRVHNTDGSSHVEEILEWDPEHRIMLRFQEFSLPLSRLATHFIETWEFNRSGRITHMRRSMAFYPQGLASWLLLLPIAGLMKKAFLNNAQQYDNEKAGG